MTAEGEIKAIHIYPDNEVARAEFVLANGDGHMVYIESDPMFRAIKSLILEYKRKAYEYKHTPSGREPDKGPRG